MIAPYATALAARGRSCGGRRQPPPADARGRRWARYGFVEALDHTPRRAVDPDADDSVVPRVQNVRAWFAHHQGMSLVALDNAVLGAPMVRRFHADARVQATEPLLQERVPRYVPVTRPRPAESRRVEAPALGGLAAPFPLTPHAASERALPVQRAVHDGGHQRGRRHQQLARALGDATARRRDLRSRQPVRLPARRAQRPALVGRAPARVPARRALQRDVPRRRRAVRAHATTGSRRASKSPCRPRTTSRCAGSRCVNHSERLREIEVTSLVEIVLAPPCRRPGAPGVPQVVPRDRVPARVHGAVVRPPPARARRTDAVGGPRGECRGRRARRHRVGDRSRALPRPRAHGREPDRARWTGALGHARARCSTRCSACGAACASRRAAGCAWRSRPAWPDSRARPWHWRRSTTIRSAASRTFALATTQTQMRLRHLGISGDEAQLYERLASHVLWTDDSLRAPAATLARNTLGQPGLWSHGISGDLPILVVRVVQRGRRGARAPGAARAGVLAAQGTARRRRDPERAPGELPGRDARAAAEPAREGHVGSVEASPRRSIPVARRWHAGGRAHRSCWPPRARCCRASAADLAEQLGSALPGARAGPMR